MYNAEGGEVMPRTGRPKVSKPKSVRFSIRLDEETEKRLIAYCDRHGVSKGEAIREALIMLLRGDT